MKWYVYTYRNEDNCVYYCGKGVGGRCYSPTGHPELPPKERIVLTYFDTEEEAWECERRLIQFWGRKDIDPYGVLLNKALGGPGSPGVPATEAQRQAGRNQFKKMYKIGGMAAAQSLQKNWILTNPLGEEKQICNLRKFCRENGLCSSNLVNVARGKYKQYRGWKCRYA